MREACIAHRGVDLAGLSFGAVLGVIFDFYLSLEESTCFFIAVCGLALGREEFAPLVTAPRERALIALGRN